jgi:hypothetical protein
MGLFGWITKKADETAEVRRWRAAWMLAVSSLDTAAVASLEDALRRMPPLAGDLEIEEEMLDGLRRLLALESEIAISGLPLVETTHRVVGTDRCHFSAPVSMPDQPNQPTGRLLLTSARAVFAGGSKVPGLPWHSSRHVLRSERDLVLVQSPEQAHRFRCNSFADALSGAAIAGHLQQSARVGRL